MISDCWLSQPEKFAPRRLLRLSVGGLLVPTRSQQAVRVGSLNLLFYQSSLLLLLLRKVSEDTLLVEKSDKKG